MENNKKDKKKKKFDFICIKNNTCKSLCEVEYFLNNFNCFINYIELFKISKKNNHK